MKKKRILCKTSVQKGFKLKFRKGVSREPRDKGNKNLQVNCS